MAHGEDRGFHDSRWAMAAVGVVLSLGLAVPAAAEARGARCPCAAARAEVARLRRHFDGVLAWLRTADTSSLTGQQRAARARNLALLERYRDRGRFPLNHDFVGRRLPFFVDEHGTHCAVGYLMAHGGAGRIVERIRRRRNHAYVHELVDEPGLGDWLAENGLSVDEAAAIQPGYAYRPGECICGYTPGLAVEATVTAVGGSNPYYPVTLRVDAVHGDASRALGVQAGDKVGSPQGPTRSEGIFYRDLPLVAVGDRVIGTNIVVPGGGGRALGRPIVKVRVSDDSVGCSSAVYGSRAPKCTPPKRPTRQQAIAAMSSRQCLSRLGAIDKLWSSTCYHIGGDVWKPTADASPGRDAGAAVDATGGRSDGGAKPAWPAGEPPDDHAGCSAAGGPRSGSSLALLVLAVWFARRRRRWAY